MASTDYTNGDCPSENGHAAQELGAGTVDPLLWLSARSREFEEGEETDPDFYAQLPETIGPFRLEAVLGRGSYGIVFRAFDRELERYVALKVAWPHIMYSAISSQRFINEPKTVASLNYPGIVKVFHSGWLGSICYIAFELIEGPTLAAWLKQHSRLPARLTAQYVCGIAKSVHFAHVIGILHRDLKPSNILLRPRAGKEAFSFEPVVTDFGLARDSRLAKLGNATATRVVVGTDQYVSPEQIAGDKTQLGPSSDVFSLGVILYEVIAGRRPFDADTVTDTHRLISTEEPPSIRSFRRDIPKELETIISKCLEKSPSRRYTSAEALADDLGRWLNHEPIQARPSTIRQRCWKYAQRRPLVVSLWLLMLLSTLTIAGLLGAWINERLTSANRIEAAEAASSVAEGMERQHQYASNIQHADAAFRRGGRREVMELLEECRVIAHDPVQRDIEWDYLWAQVNDFDASLDAHDGAVHDVRFTSSSDTLISAGEDGQVILWDMATLKPRLKWNDQIGEVNVAVPSADGSLVAIAGDDGRVVVRRLADGAVVFDEPVVPGRVFALAWLGSKLEFAVGGSGAVLHVIEPLTGSHRQTESLPPLPSGRSADSSHPVEIAGLDYLPAQGKIAVTIEPSGVHVLDESSLAPTKTSAAELLVRGAICYLPIGPGYFAERTVESLIRIRAISDGALVAEIQEPRSLRKLSYSSAAGVLVGAFRDGTIGTWNIEKVLARHPPGGRLFYGHNGRASAAEISPNGHYLASGGQDGKIRLWRNRQLQTQVDVPIEMPSTIEFSPCGRWLAVVGGQEGPQRRITMFDAQTRLELWKSEVRDPPESLREANFPQLLKRQIAFDPTGETIICVDTDFVIREYHVLSGRVVKLHSLPEGSPPVRIHPSPDGRTLLVVRATNDAIVVDRTSGAWIDYKKEASTNCWGAFHTPHGNFWLESDTSRNFLSRAAPSATPLFTLRGMSGNIHTLAVSRDGRYLAVGGGDRIIWFWDIQDGGPPNKCIGHEGTIDGLFFSPDAHTIVSRSWDGTVRLWHVPTCAELVKLGTPDEWISCVGANPAGTLLVLGIIHDGQWGLRFHELGRHGDSRPEGVGKPTMAEQ